ncbi:MAG: outer membrane lipoprotein carrier protein LolA [Flavobacteriales bacterium]|nr:outer membrane lipoprotein carrier protein LolA [Flavobacteriales bacterium]
MRAAITTLLLALCTLVHGQFSAIGPDHEAVKGLLAATRAMRTVQATFVQEKHLRALKEPVSEPGRFVYERPDRFRWSVDGAAPLSILTAGPLVRVKEKGAEKRLGPAEQRLYASIDALVLDLVGGRLLDSPEMKPRYELGGDVLVAHLTPVGAMARRVQRMVLRFDRRTYRLREMETVELDGDRTVVRYTDVQVDKPVSSGAFTDL